VRVAIVDIGTNSTRLLVADVDPGSGSVLELVRHSNVTRLGHGVDATGALDADAMERGDADLLVSMLASDVAYTMPPSPTCLRGHAAIRQFIRDDVAPQRWQHRATRANGQLAVGCYMLDPGRGRYLAVAIDVLTLDGDRITAIRAFLTAEVLGQPGWDGSFAAADFAGFGLPAELPG